MNQGSEPESKTWWQTLPGLLTAAAAIITALTGLLIALHQAGFFERNNHQPASQTQSQSHTVGDSSNPIDAGTARISAGAGVTASRPLTLPESTEIRSGQTVFKLLSARLDPYSPDRVSVHFTVRMTNNDRFDANLWSASFRLLVDGSLQPPTNNLDELVAAQSAKEGDVEFVIPATMSTVGLQMGEVGSGRPTIPISLQNARR